ncbi:hypothetical protein PV682_13520 [Streptomyces niveiscabiei]|uniref:DUF6059 family protein n=1 Tax=Streptomyces niveiscabiei TaxID=164115 RepID=UPI0029B92DA4|nr:DUF6059 family protein [Streptomyces niveiscabiei]MDX3382475.1 hypothetical protein [Streptomyces niveiscabiei]
MVVRWFRRWLREFVKSVQVMGALAVGMSPEVLDEKAHPPALPDPPAGLPGPGHPERAVPDVPPTPEERSLWSRLR